MLIAEARARDDVGRLGRPASMQIITAGGSGHAYGVMGDGSSMHVHHHGPRADEDVE